jgi:5-dehydro-2-deoxygluconokinase
MRREEGALLMITGYTRPLYILPFDHRASYISGLFGWKEPLNVEQMVSVSQSKQVIYAGFQQAIADQVPKDRVGIPVDEEFGVAILRDAASKGYIIPNGILNLDSEVGEKHHGAKVLRLSAEFSETLAKPLDHQIKGGKDLVMKVLLAQFFP